jgi:hypothetical protein
MSNSTLFKQAHALTRATLRAGDNYRATFELCLRYIIAIADDASLTVVSKRAIIKRAPMAANQFNATFDAIGYKAPRQPIGYYKPARFNFKAILTAIAFVLAAMVILSFA